MKFSLVFLALCYVLVASSYGQNFLYWPLSYRNINPLWADSPVIADRLVPYSPRRPQQYYDYLDDSSYFRPKSQQQFEEDESYIIGDEDNIFARNKFLAETSSKIKQRLGTQHQQMGKQLLRGRATITTYTTTFAYTTTVTPTSIVKCIGSEQFSKVDDKPVSKACRRKKEMLGQTLDYDEEIMQQEEIFPISEINPSSASQQIETTESVMGNITDIGRAQREIESSSLDLLDDDHQHHQNERTLSEVSPRFGFQLLNSILFPAPSLRIITITIPTTVVFAQPTSMFSSATFVDLDAQATPSAPDEDLLLKCLPEGFVVCP